MTTEQITARLEELRNTAKQHEAVLLQISGAIQELQNGQIKTFKLLQIPYNNLFPTFK